MKRKISKFLALCLAVTSATAFSATGVSAGSTSGTIASSFTIESPTLVVTVPTSVKLYVNENFTGNTTGNSADTARKGFSIVSDDILISNATVKDGAGVPVMVTVDAKLNADSDVNVEYATGKVDENGDEADKSVFLNLVALNDTTPANIFKVTAGTQNTNAGYYEILADVAGGSNNKITSVVTPYGSQVQTKLAGLDNTPATPDTQATPKYMGVSLQGEINTQADWEANDLAVDISYKIKSTNASSNAKTTPTEMTLADDGTNYKSLTAFQGALGLATAPTTNGLTSATAWNGSSYATDGYLVLQDAGSTVVPTKVAVYFTELDNTKTYYECTADDVILGNMQDNKISSPQKEARSAYVVLKKSSGVNTYLSNIAKSKNENVTVKMFIALSDGRVIVQDMTYNK